MTDTTEVPGFSAEEVAEAQASLDTPPEPAPAPPSPAPDAPADPAAAPAPAPDDDDIPEVQVVGDRRLVPVSALAAERKARQEQARQFAELRGQVEAWNRAMDMARGQQPQGQPQAPQGPPNVEDDPIGAVRYAIETQQALIQHLQGQSQQSQMVQAYRQDAQAFAQKQPDFPAAYNHLLKSRAGELEAMGATPQQVNAQLQADELELVQTARQLGKSAAELVYGYAKARGYSAKPAAAAPAPAQPVTPAPALAARAAAANPVATGGTAPGNDLTPQHLLSLDGAAFEKGWEKLIGGKKSGLWRN